MAFGKLFVDLALRDKGFSASLKKAGGDVKALEKTASGLNKVIGGTLVKAFKVGTVAISAFGAASVKVGNDFQHSITLVKSLSKDGIENFAALSDEARRLGATTEFSARQSAEAMTNFARAGMDAREIIAATGPALMLAGGAGESMSLATLTMAASLRQFTLDASESGHVADVFTLALKNSLFNLQGLGDAMKYAGPAGAAFGMSVEETTAAVAQFRNMGLDASMAGTAFRMSMVALAKQTPAMTKVMEKYGITSEQVSVTNIGFAEVLNNLADAGVTAEDAIKMFGARAGANMGLLIEQMRKPEIRQGFKDLTTDLYESSQGAGAAKEQYDEMGKTVQRQFLIAKSAFEELLITTFDTYKSDLMDFLAALGEVVQHTADTFRGLSVSGSGFNNMLQASTAFLRANKDEIAEFFISVFNGVQKTAEAILALMPLLTTLGNLFLTAFPTLVVTSMVFGLGTLTTAFQVATAAAGKFGITVGIALGPVGAIAIGITAFATAVFKLDKFLQGTISTVKDYTAEIERLEGQQARAAKRGTKVQGEILKAQKENFESQAEYMRSLGATEAQVERYRQRLNALTADTVSQQLAAGTLVEVNRDGVTEFHNVAMAAHMLGEDGIGPLEDRIEGANRAVDGQIKRNEVLQARINMVMGVEDEYTSILNARGMTQEHLRNVMKASGETIGDWKAQLNFGIERVKQFKTDVGNATSALNKYNLALAGARDGGPVDFGQGIGSGTVTDKPDDSAIKEAQKRRERRAQMLLDLQRMEEDYQAELAKIGLEGIELKKFELDQIKQEINRAHDDQLKDAKDLNIQKEIEESRSNALRMAMRIEVAQQELEAQKQADAVMAEQAKAKEALLNEIAARGVIERSDHEATAIIENGRFLREIELNNVRLTDEERFRLDQDFRMRRLSAAHADLSNRIGAENRFATFEEKLHLAKLASEIKTQNKIKAIHDKAAANDVKRVAKTRKLEAKLANATTEKQKNRLKKRIKNIEFFSKLETVNNKEKIKKILEQEKNKFEAIEKIQEIANKTGISKAAEGARNAGQKFKEILEDAKSEEPKTGWGKFFSGIGKAAKGAAKVMKGILNNPLVDLGKKAVNVFKSLSGFSFDPMAMADDAMGKKEELGDAAVEREAARREEAGEEAMTAEEEAAVRERGERSFDPKEAAAEVAKEQANAMVERLNMVIEMIPVFVQKLAESLPILVTAFVDGFPEMVKALVSALNGPDGLINVIARAVPDLISTVVAAIPDFIMPLIRGLFNFIKDGIPQIIESLTTMIPELIMKLAEGLPLLIEAIVAMIPKVLQSIIEMLPNLLESLIALVLNLVTSLLEQIPILIVELVNQIPVLITALVDAIPLIIDRVITSLPKIITALINAIPIIILGLIKAIPKLIESVVRAIPILIKAIFVGLGQIILSLVSDLPRMLANAISKAFSKAWKGIKKAFNSLFEKLNPANWFGDTPGAVQVGPEPQTFGFMPNDYVIAAKRPSDLLNQATELIEKKGIPRINRGSRQNAVAQMSASPIGSMFGDNPQMSPAQRLAQNIKVEVEGETIDNALIVARQRGRAPQIWNEIERVAGGGASIGIERHDAE